jgi:hypothetical protein
VSTAIFSLDRLRYIRCQRLDDTALRDAATLALADNTAQLSGEPPEVADLALDICQMVAGDGVDLLAISPDVPRESQENAHFLDGEAEVAGAVHEGEAVHVAAVVNTIARGRGGTGPMIPLGQLASIRVTQGPPSIRTENAQLVAYVFVDMRGRDMGGFVADAARAVSDT